MSGKGKLPDGVIVPLDLALDDLPKILGLWRKVYNRAKEQQDLVLVTALGDMRDLLAGVKDNTEKARRYRVPGSVEGKTTEQ